VHLQRAGMGTGRKTMVSMTTTMKKGMALRKGTPYNKIIGEKEVIIADGKVETIYTCGFEE